ncbi:hypothetical protein ACQP2P_45765 [Dactylosporangium sp. CA-139114]|uniref:hypothetical protein n=1 Tax=Dactylosporangium sp. CA-139114 TaxID=3239931 RepID=UPI003D9572DD
MVAPACAGDRRGPAAPATDDELDEIRDPLGIDLPADPLTVLRWPNGSGFGDSGRYSDDPDDIVEIEDGFLVPRAWICVPEPAGP